MSIKAIISCVLLNFLYFHCETILIFNCLVQQSCYFTIFIRNSLIEHIQIT